MLKDIPGFEGLYSATENGEIISHIPTGGQNRIKRADRIINKILKLSKHKKTGYLRCTLCDYQNKFDKLVHRLIAETFIPNPFKKPEVNHKNGNKLDNRLSNLEWMTSKENTNHAICLGLIDNNGEKSKTSKLKSNQVKEILILLGNGESQTKIAKKYGVTNHTIHKIWKKINWKKII